MNIPNVRKWIVDLRSGEYQQGMNALQYRNSYCCLGVGSRTAEKNGMRIKLATMENSLIGGSLSSQPQASEWLDLSNDIESTLINMNDYEKKSFDKIADYLEEEIAHQESKG